MEILLIVKNIFNFIINWMGNHPVISGGIFTILGAILSAILDLRKYTINKFKVVENKVKKNRFIALIIGSHNKIIQSSLEADSEDSIPSVADTIASSEYKGPLNKTQREICSRVNTLSGRFSESVDIEPYYEDAVRNMNTNNVNLAAGKFVQVFNKIGDSLKAIAEDNNASTELNQLIVVTDGLYQMIHKSDAEKFKRQINSCEEITWKLLVKLPL